MSFAFFENTPGLGITGSLRELSFASWLDTPEGSSGRLKFDRRSERFRGFL
jgi:hypothetical protein